MKAQDQKTLMIVGGLAALGIGAYFLMRKPSLADLQAKHAAAVQEQGDFATAAKLASDIANSPIGGSLAGGLTQLFTPTPPADDSSGSSDGSDTSSN